MSKFVLIILGLIFVLGLLITGWILVTVHTAPAEVLFKLNDPSATYSIKKTFPSDANHSYPIYWVIYNNDEVLVGNSKIGLDDFIGKKVEITGSYNGRISKEQCIISSCHLLYVSASVIDIDSIKVLQESLLPN